MNTPPVVSPEEWRAAREELLVKEKELTRARDALAAERRRMPRQAVTKEYTFEGPDGEGARLAPLTERATALAYASRAPQSEIARLREEMGWEVPWYTLTDDWDRDFG